MLEEAAKNVMLRWRFGFQQEDMQNVESELQPNGLDQNYFIC